ncbi:DUF421 domain-containing protein [Bacillus wiedmannii]|uniref:DUF421 domain-containing protein n=1 Tax=Bacillus wiedmannii TaxID=1890302 RepID=UPI003665F422
MEWVSIIGRTILLYIIILIIFRLMCIQIILSVISLKFQRFRHLIEGEPAILVNAGKIDEKKMRNQRYNIDDLLMQLREQGVGDIRDVEYAILEPSGKLSVFQKQKGKHIDGEIQLNHLQMIEHTDEWLIGKLKNLGYNDIAQILYCSFQNGQFFVDLKEN